MNRQPDDPGEDIDPDDDRYDFGPVGWGMVGALVAVILITSATLLFAKETDAGQERPPCDSSVPMCCWAPGSLPICQLED